MSYIPDGLAKRRRQDKISPNARDIFEVYCDHADQETGFAFPSIQTIAKELDMRLDHAKDYNAELIKEGWIVPQVLGNRQGYVLKAGYKTLSERRKEKAQSKPEPPQPEEKPVETAPQNLGNDPNQDEKALPKTWEDTQNLGNMSESSTQDSGSTPQNLGTNSPNLGNFSQNLGTAQELQNSEVFSEPASLTSLSNQPCEPAGSNAQARARKSPAKPLPKNFTITEPMREWARHQFVEHGFELDLDAQTVKFRNHAESNDRRQVNWEAAWRNWILKSLENRWGVKPANKPDTGNLSAAGAATAAKMDNIAKEWGFQ
jgi:hypothetical protein